MRIVSLLTAIVLLVPVVGQCPTLNIFIARADVIESLNSDDEDIYAAQYEALNYAILSVSGDWSQAHYKDGLPWNYFHNAVQDHIADELYPGIINKERKIPFNKRVQNPVTERYTDYGKADLWMNTVDDKKKNAIAVWEIKPASYLIEPTKTKGIKQLNNYTNSELWAEAGANYINGKLSPYIGIGEFRRTISNGHVYSIRYENTYDGLILYWFDLIDDDSSSQNENSRSENSSNNINIPDYNNTLVYDNVASYDQAKSNLETFVMANPDIIATLINPATFEMYKNIANYLYGFSTTYPGNETSIAEEASTTSLIVIISIECIEEAIASGDLYRIAEVAESITTFYMYADLLDYIADFMPISDYEVPGFSTRTRISTLAADITQQMPIIDKTTNDAHKIIKRKVNNSTNTSSKKDNNSSSSSDTSSKSGRNPSNGEVVEDAAGSANSNKERAENTRGRNGRYDPLILDLDGDGYGINSKKKGTHFDLNCDGFAERINWTNSDGILAIDKNGNGKIDNGREVFGDSFILNNGQKAKNGFEALTQYDTNNDNFFDTKDRDFYKFYLWIDSNENGISEAKELCKLSETNIARINLEYSYVNSVTGSEAIIGNESYFEYKNGEVCKIGEMWVSADLYDAMELMIAEPTEEIAGLPNVRSLGKVNSLYTSMINDHTGKLRKLVIDFTNETDYDKRIELVKQMLDIMCNTSNIKPYSRGNHIDAKELAVIEAVLGSDFIGIDGANPNREAATILNTVYADIVDIYFYALISCDINEYISYISTDSDGENISYDMSNFNANMLNNLKNNTIDQNKFAEICSYLNYFSKVKLGNNSLLHEFIDYVYYREDTYIPLIYRSIYGVINGTNESDKISGATSDDIILSGEGDDTIYGGNGYDRILGEQGNDTIDGGAGNDILDGGTGNDKIVGCSGDDTYFFDFGYGQDTLSEGGYGETTDRVVFGKGIKAEDLIVSKDGSDMILSFNGMDDTIRIINQYFKKNFQIETYEFADGTILTVDDLLNTPLHIHGEGTINDNQTSFGTWSNYLYGSDNNDTINANAGDDHLFGYGGNDELNGGEGNDILDGGTGDDKLNGRKGDDTYIFNLGYGHDTINEENYNGINDKVIFGKGLKAEDLIVSKDGYDMIVSFKDIDDTLRITSQYYKQGFQVEKYEFADGTILTIDDLLNKPSHIHGEGTINDNQSSFGTRSNYLYGSEKNDTINANAGDDHLYGYGGNDELNGSDGDDILDGGTGDDKLNGGRGDDTYIFNLGYGNDTINESISNSINDKVVFGEGIKPEDIVVSRESWDMILSVRDSEDSIRICTVYYKNGYWIESYVFEDGTVITGEEMINTPLEIHGEEKINDYSGGLGSKDRRMYGSDSDDTITAGSGNDLLYGYDGDDIINGNGGNDVLDGGPGNDMLCGGRDDDTYIFNLGYGHDTVNDGNSGSKNDKVVFGEGIRPEDIELRRDKNAIVLSIKDTDDILTIADQFCFDNYRVETYEFSDGTIAEIDKATLSFVILVEGIGFDQVTTEGETIFFESDMYIEDDKIIELFNNSESQIA